MNKKEMKGKCFKQDKRLDNSPSLFIINSLNNRERYTLPLSGFNSSCSLQIHQMHVAERLPRSSRPEQQLVSPKGLGSKP